LDIVFVPGFVSHVERAWEEPRTKQFLAALSGLGRLIFFDRRGVGLSDRVGAAPTVAATADDIATVLDAAVSRAATASGGFGGGRGLHRLRSSRARRARGLGALGLVCPRLRVGRLSRGAEPRPV